MKSRQARRQKFLNGVRHFNKHIFNRFMLLIAGRKGIPFTVLHHTGRRSGRSYRTPVLATYVEEAIIIPLTYGEHVDWLRNILTHGACRLMWQGEMIPAHQPTVLEAEAGLATLPEKRREQFTRFRIEKFLRLIRR
ncbi:MAG TPA: nitroreductase family deazaflavin-dependent oxidoreductase [Anaerolineae bacterium]|nr:nitroreductase family deazaflavin-dependent oxidoreductase [Anaerolineae bacterium]